MKWVLEPAESGGDAKKPGLKWPGLFNVGCHGLEVAATLLLKLERLEQRFEVTLTEAL